VPFSCPSVNFTYQYVVQSIAARDGEFGLLQGRVEGFRTVLAATSRETSPLDWAQAQMNIASGLLTIGDRVKSPGHLEEGVARLEAATIVYQEHKMTDLLKVLASQIVEAKAKLSALSSGR
jgi:hypothetical protein